MNARDINAPRNRSGRHAWTGARPEDNAQQPNILRDLNEMIANMPVRKHLAATPGWYDVLVAFYGADCVHPIPYDDETEEEKVYTYNSDGSPLKPIDLPRNRAERRHP